jgi:hypothetical protein
MYSKQKRILITKSRAVLLPQDKVPEQHVQPVQPVEQPVARWMWRRPDPPSTLEWLVAQGFGYDYKPVTQLIQEDHQRDAACEERGQGGESHRFHPPDQGRNGPTV